MYGLGAVHTTAGRFSEAVAVLTEALTMYEQLPTALGPAPAGLVADVRARRGVAHAWGGAGASAVVDVQAAIVGYIRRAAPERVDEDYLALSRVLMISADVLGAYGDPSVGLTAAHTGLSWCVTALRTGALAPDDAMHTAMVRALSVERDLLVGLDRGDEVGNAEGLLRGLGAEAVPTLIAERMAGDSPGLLLSVADAVAATGDPGLAALLCAEPVGPLCAPVLRMQPQQLVEAGLAALDAALRLLPADPDSAVRLGLEARHLLAFAYEGQLPEFTGRNDETCLLWCRLLAALSDQCAADGDTHLAGDLAAWGARVSLMISVNYADEHVDALTAATHTLDRYTGR